VGVERGRIVLVTNKGVQKDCQALLEHAALAEADGW